MTRILVVEDEESLSDPLSYMLRKEGFEVALADTGPAALEEFDRRGADLVLLDLMLPGLSGTEVCRALRSRSCSEIPGPSSLTLISAMEPSGSLTWRTATVTRVPSGA